MHIIDMYEKYENMDKRQIVNALINAEKKEIKMRDELNTHIELVKFLKSKLKKVIDTPSAIKEKKWLTLDELSINEVCEQWKKENPEEAIKIHQELLEEIGE